MSALIAPLAVHTQLIRQEVPIMIGASLLLLVAMLDGRLSSVYVYFLVRQSRAETRHTKEIYAEAVADRHRWDRHWSVQLLLILVGLGLLVVGSNWLVDASVAFARAMGVSDDAEAARRGARRWRSSPVGCPYAAPRRASWQEI